MSRGGRWMPIGRILRELPFVRGRFPEVPRPGGLDAKQGVARGFFPGGPSETVPRPDMTLGNFVLSRGNELAYKASIRFSRGHSSSTSSLLLHGRPGVGKTHLLSGMYHEIVRSQGNRQKALFVRLPDFGCEFAGALQRRDGARFREKYRRADVLFLDDLHRISPSRAVQQELRHTLDCLSGGGGRVALGSAWHPRDLGGLAEPLRDRLASALDVEIHPADARTKLVILRGMLAEQRRHLPEEVVALVADETPGGGHELGKVVEEIFRTRDLSASGALCAIERLRRLCVRPVAIEEVERLVAREFSLSSVELRSSACHRSQSLPRQICFLLGHSLCGLSTAVIGSRFGGRDRSSVLAGIRALRRRMEEEPALRRRVEELSDRLHGFPGEPV